MIENVLLIGTGLIGSSIGLGLSEAGFAGRVVGWDAGENNRRGALAAGAVDAMCASAEEVMERARAECDLVVLATPVLGILDWMERLAPVCGERTLMTDVGSTKLEIVRGAERLYNRPGRARFVPGHPMAGKERGGAELAEAGLFAGAMWLFTPPPGTTRAAAEEEWRTWVERMGARTMDMDAARHDELCAWVSHLPQMLSTALAALLQERFGASPELWGDLMQVGGRALRETTRLGSSPYSMWRDVAMTNTGAIADSLLALEQELAHVRENLRTPELREEFARANRFRVGPG